MCLGKSSRKTVRCMLNFSRRRKVRHRKTLATLAFASHGATFHCFSLFSLPIVKWVQVLNGKVSLYFFKVFHVFLYQKKIRKHKKKEKFFFTTQSHIRQANSLGWLVEFSAPFCSRRLRYLKFFCSIFMSSSSCSENIEAPRTRAFGLSWTSSTSRGSTVKNQYLIRSNLSWLASIALTTNSTLFNYFPCV